MVQAVQKKGQVQSPIINSVTEFLSYIYDLPAFDGIRCFRGEADASWALKPSVMRNLRPDAENSIISELMAEAPAEFNEDRSMFARLVRAQHYGLPTRLLDVSLNPLVALYFACADEPHQNKDGRLLVLGFGKDRIKYPDSDTVSLICNLSRLTDAERNELKLFTEKTNFNEKEFFKLPITNKLSQIIQLEKPYFLNRMKRSDLKKYFLVHPPKSNRRVGAQSGAFVAAGLLEYKSTHRARSFTTISVTIPSSSKISILENLDILNINSRSLFPEIEYTSRYIKRKWEKEKTSDIEDLFIDMSGRLPKRNPA